MLAVKVDSMKCVNIRSEFVWRSTNEVFRNTARLRLYYKTTPYPGLISNSLTDRINEIILEQYLRLTKSKTAIAMDGLLITAPTKTGVTCGTGKNLVFMYKMKRRLTKV